MFHVLFSINLQCPCNFFNKLCKMLASQDLHTAYRISRHQPSDWVLNNNTAIIQHSVFTVTWTLTPHWQFCVWHKLTASHWVAWMSSAAQQYLKRFTFLSHDYSLWCYNGYGLSILKMFSLPVNQQHRERTEVWLWKLFKNVSHGWWYNAVVT